jgi:hypothetical protein
MVNLILIQVSDALLVEHIVDNVNKMENVPSASKVMLLKMEFVWIVIKIHVLVNKYHHYS